MSIYKKKHKCFSILYNIY